MTVDGTLDALLSEATPHLRDALRRAYDLGYRDALAAGSALRDARAPAEATDGSDEFEFDATGAEDAPTGTSPETDPLAPDRSEEHATTSAEIIPIQWTDGGDDRGDAASGSRAKSPLLRILPHATVGTLLERIVYHFDLSRFDIDVVVCRKGDRTRRQLKTSVRLSKYEVEG